MGHNIKRGMRRELKHGPFDCRDDLEFVTPRLARLKWRTAWGCQAYIVHERYYATMISKMWQNPRYACLEELTNVGEDNWFLTSPLPVSQVTKQQNFKYSQTPFFMNCIGKSDVAVLSQETVTNAPRQMIQTKACNTSLLHNYQCNSINNRRSCNWDGGDCTDNRPYNKRLSSTNSAAVAHAAITTQKLIASTSKRQLFPRIHVLHIPKAGGLSIRSTIGCFCGSDDFDDPAGGKGAGHCDRTTTHGPFICHGHSVTCADLPPGEPYAVFFRNP